VHRLVHLLLLSVIYFLSIIIEIIEGIFIFSGQIYYLFYSIIGLIVLMPLLEYISYRKISILKFYPISIFILSTFLTILMDFNYFPALALQIIALIFSIRYIMDNDRMKKYHLVYIIYGFLMLLLSSLLRVISFERLSQVLIFNIGDDINVKGVPFFFSNGVVIAGMRYFVFSFSFQYMIIILILGFLLLENARKIIQISKVKNQGKSNLLNLTSMSFSVFSCQCETVTSIIPAIGAEILGIISLPIITESLILSIGTFLYLHFVQRERYGIFGKLWNSKKKRKGLLFIALLIMILSPILITFGVYFGLQRNLLFYFGTNLGLFAVSSLIFTRLFSEIRISIGISKVLYVFLALLTIFFMVVWYVPAVLDVAVKNGLIFSIMGLFSVLSGILLSLMLTPINKIGRSIIYEYITGMFPVVFVIVLYYTVITSSQIWPAFSITSQLIFGLVLLGISLPIMWFSTNYSIYGNYIANKDTHR